MSANLFTVSAPESVGTTSMDTEQSEPVLAPVNGNTTGVIKVTDMFAVSVPDAAEAQDIEVKHPILSATIAKIEDFMECFI